jgi:APA family basic amino acid/polyamine antiporter
MTALARRLGLRDAVVLGVGAMLGAGVFVAYGPATAAAGAAVPLSLLLAAALAWANADSTARLARVLPVSGGAYAYGRARLHPFWGGVAGVAFLVGKTASVAAIAVTVGTYVWPGQARALAVGAVVTLTALAAAGLQRSARVTGVVVALVLGVLLAVAVLALVTSPRHGWPGWPGWPGPATDVGAADVTGVLQGAGVLFFAFAGYARVATLGEEVRTPERTLPRAIATALAVVLVVYAVVGAVLLGVLGVDGVAASNRPVAAVVRVLADAAAPGGTAWSGWEAVVVLTAVVAALTSGLGVLLGMSRTALAMARDGLLPRSLARLAGSAEEPRPALAQIVVGTAATVAAALLDLPTAIALSSAAVLVYYGIAHAAAWTLPGRARRIVPLLGATGCLTVALAVAT